ncbi:uncharacterized protein LOC129291567 isoform X2 [Prosopis cineraria]|uniref:uncharacterized protein LOC129291567 isoform X2 n=1 Tax=Prosopis cineraria TaxID=364024 RepID=UPI00240FE750|nr:uncharacterized protein LOC129291567 isoform X2 [Prosopis cineraria]
MVGLQVLETVNATVFQDKNHIYGSQDYYSGLKMIMQEEGWPFGLLHGRIGLVQNDSDFSGSILTASPTSFTHPSSDLESQVDSEGLWVRENGRRRVKWEMKHTPWRKRDERWVHVDDAGHLLLNLSFDGQLMVNLTARQKRTFFFESPGSLFHEKTITLGTLIGDSSLLELSQRLNRGRTVVDPTKDSNKKSHKMKPWLLSLCSKKTTDAVSVKDGPSLGHYLEAERRAATSFRFNHSVCASSHFSPIQRSNSLSSPCILKLENP